MTTSSVTNLEPMSARSSLLQNEARTLSFVCLHSTLEEWDEILDGLPERKIFQSTEWLSFVAKVQGGDCIGFPSK
jgi:hypothetical protein